MQTVNELREKWKQVETKYDSGVKVEHDPNTGEVRNVTLPAEPKPVPVELVKKHWWSKPVAEQKVFKAIAKLFSDEIDPEKFDAFQNYTKTIILIVRIFKFLLMIYLINSIPMLSGPIGDMIEGIIEALQ